MLKVFGGMVAALMLMTGVQSASAAPITYTSYSVLNAQNVSLTDSSLGITNELAGAGQITLNGTNTPGGSLAVWCIDILHNLASAGSLASTNSVASNTIEALILNGTKVLLNMLPADYDASAAIQVAIWKTLYTHLEVTASNDNIITLADTYLSYVAKGTWQSDPNQQISMLDGGIGNQSQGTVAPVPEPASILALGAGLVALGFVARRRRSNTLAA